MGERSTGSDTTGDAPTPSGNPYNLKENRQQVALMKLAQLLAQYPGAVVLDDTHIQMPNGRIRTIEVDADGNPKLSEQWTEGDSADWLEANGLPTGPGGAGGSGSSPARLASDDPRYWADLDRQFAESQRQFNADLSENQRQFDLSTEEGRRQFNLDYNRGVQTDAAAIGLDYAKLNQNERQFVQDLAFQYYNSFNDAETGRRQALATLIQARNNNITNLAGLQADISAQWAQMAANPRDAFAEANYRAAIGGATPFGSTNNAQFGEYEQAAKDKVQQIFGPAGNMLQNAYQYATQPIPQEYLTPVPAPPKLEAPKQILPPALNMPLAQYADNPNPTARALLSLRDLGVNNYSDAERAALTQIATGGQPQAPQPAPAPTPTKQFSAAEKAWINGVARSKGEAEPYPGFAQGGTVTVRPLGMATGGTINFAGLRGMAPTPEWMGRSNDRGVSGLRVDPATVAAARQNLYDYAVAYRQKLAGQGITPDFALQPMSPVPGHPTPASEGFVPTNPVLAHNVGGQVGVPMTSSDTAAAKAPGTTMQSIQQLRAQGQNPTIPEHIQRRNQTPFRIPGAAEGGQFNFDELWNSRTQPGQAPTDTEGGLNMNLNERAIILTESGQVVATLGERRPDGSIRREQLIVKPLKSEVAMDKKMEEQNKQAVESQKKTLAAFANGGTVASGQGGMESIRALLRSLDPSLVPQAGQQLPDPRLLAPLYGRFQQDKDLYDLVRGAYSTQGISDNNLDYTLGQFQPRQLQGVPQVSYR